MNVLVILNYPVILSQLVILSEAKNLKTIIRNKKY